MARRGRRKKYFKKSRFKISLKKRTVFSISAVVFLLLSILTFISFFSQNIGSNFLQNKINLFFGWGSFLVPPILGLIGLLFLPIVNLPFVNTAVLFGLLLFSISFLGFIHLILLNPFTAKTQAFLGEGGGLIGYYTGIFLSQSFSKIGAIVIFSTGVVVSLLFIFNTSLDELMLFLMRIAKFLNSYLQLSWGSAKKILKKEWEEKATETTKEEIRITPAVATSGAEKRTVEKTKATTMDAAIKKAPFTPLVWEYPPLDLLSDGMDKEAVRGDIKRNAQTIEKTLESFGIRARVVEINQGPAVTQYGLESAQGTKIAKITNLQNDLALALASPTGSVRIVAPIPGKSLIGIEVPNISASIVSLKNILRSEPMKNVKPKLTVALGCDVSGQVIIDNISRMPHILVAGATGSGKSVLLHSFISTILFRATPDEVKFILVDPKRVELPRYNGIPHLLTPVIVDPDKSLPALQWLLREMERRYLLFEKVNARDINAYNEASGFQALPYILYIVDELADLMIRAAVEVEKSICRLAQMARATGIHLILATQRPSVDVLTGLIKANIPCRIAFSVISQIDSRVIIDHIGAEKLLGRGDMLFLPPDASKPTRIQGVYVAEQELRNLINFLKQSSVKPEYKDEVTTTSVPTQLEEPEDELFNEAVTAVWEAGKASASLLQRRLRIGYARAARILDEMEQRGIVGSQDGSKARNVLIGDPREVLGEKSSDTDTSFVNENLPGH